MFKVFGKHQLQVEKALLRLTQVQALTRQGCLQLKQPTSLHPVSLHLLNMIPGISI
jgi:hypothetical protein